MPRGPRSSTGRVAALPGALVAGVAAALAVGLPSAAGTAATSTSTSGTTVNTMSGGPPPTFGSLVDLVAGAHYASTSGTLLVTRRGPSGLGRKTRPRPVTLSFDVEPDKSLLTGIRLSRFGCATTPPSAIPFVVGDLTAVLGGSRRTGSPRVRLTIRVRSHSFAILARKVTPATRIRLSISGRFPAPAGTQPAGVGDVRFDYLATRSSGSSCAARARFRVAPQPHS